MASSPISPASAHTDAALTDFASAYTNDSFVADSVCPVILTDSESDVFYKRSRKDVSTELDNSLGARGKMNEASYDLTTGSFQCLGYGLKEAVSNSLLANADEIIDPREFAASNVMQRNMLSREIRVATLMTTSGNWASGNTSASSNYWSDDSNGTPVDDIHTALEAVPMGGDDSRLIGVCSLEVFHALRKHPQVRDMHGTGQGQLSREVLATYLELDELFVSKAHKNTANTGQTASYSRVWSGTSFVIAKVPTQLLSPQQQIFSATFRKRFDGQGQGFQTRSWFTDDEGFGGTEFVACEHKDDEVVIQNDQGYLRTGVLA